MKRATFKLVPAKGGWIRTTLSPINDKHEARFGFMDLTMFLALTIGTVALARVLLAH
jgi:hypothetical protein